MVSQNYERVPDTKRSPADPQKDAGLFSLLTFWWMNGVFQTGAKRPLEESDFLPLQEQDETQRLTENIQKLWSCEKKKYAESNVIIRYMRSWAHELGLINLNIYYKEFAKQGLQELSIDVLSYRIRQTTVEYT